MACCSLFQTLNLKLETIKKMNKLDKQFGEMMKGISIDSPSADFTLKVMSRVQAEAAVRKHHLLEDYQPVISKRTWIILITGFVLLMVYIMVLGNESTTAGDTGFWSTIFGSLDQLKVKQATSIWQKGIGIFSSVPALAYLILTASLALWTIDSYLTRFKQHHAKI
jgi:uncharacterized protein with PQ loop repeat